MIVAVKFCGVGWIVWWAVLIFIWIIYWFFVLLKTYFFNLVGILIRLQVDFSLIYDLFIPIVRKTNCVSKCSVHFWFVLSKWCIRWKVKSAMQELIANMRAWCRVLLCRPYQWCSVMKAWIQCRFFCIFLNLGSRLYIICEVNPCMVYLLSHLETGGNKCIRLVLIKQWYC